MEKNIKHRYGLNCANVDLDAVFVETDASNKLAIMLLHVANTQFGISDKDNAINILDLAKGGILCDGTLSISLQLPTGGDVCVYVPPHQWGESSNSRQASFKERIHAAWLSIDAGRNQLPDGL